MNDQQDQTPLPQANPGYVLGQLAQALMTSETHPDATIRERALHKVARWQKNFQGMLSGALRIGSRTPLRHTPAWVTLDVLKGGFASGDLLAGGPLQPHEIALLEQLPPLQGVSERAIINSYYLSEAGFAVLQEMLRSGHYRVNVPEEGALLVIAWLSSHGRAAEARALLDVIGPFFERLRFYPLPADQPLPINDVVARRNVSMVIADLRAVRVRPQRAREREDLLVWAPLYDQALALFAETVAGEQPFVPLDAAGRPLRRDNGHYQVAGGWPCRQYPADWADRARQLLAVYAEQRSTHRLSPKPERDSASFASLRGYIERILENPADLSGREVGRIRALLAAAAFKRGRPGSPQHAALRREQARTAALPAPADLAPLLIRRLEPLPQDQGLADPAALLDPVSPVEAAATGLPVEAPVPSALADKVNRALAAPVEELIARGILSSGEELARLVPQLSAQARVAAVADAELRRLYHALYTAFRRRRSLLLFNLQHQVQFAELPWVRVIEPDQAASEQARALLQRIVALALISFPQQILPNTLLQEVRALAASAGLDLPIVDEVAADIFMGSFSVKYLRAAQVAGRLLAGSLYERYYGLDYAAVRCIDDVQKSRYGVATSAAFDRLCHELAGVSNDGPRWSVSRNGMIIEQEQILTTHNLAVLFEALELQDLLLARLPEMARECFGWICAELQVDRGGWQAGLRASKNSAYAWRQMVFYLSMLPEEEVTSFLAWAEEELAAQPADFRAHFRPVLSGLQQATAGRPMREPARRFLGWTSGDHIKS
jgi:hypothetical protein